MAELFDILNFSYVEIEDVDVPTSAPAWTDVTSLNVVDAAPGTYSLGFMLIFEFDTTSQSFVYQFSLDGGITWGTEYTKENQDRSNTEVVEHSDVIAHTGGNIALAVRATKEGGIAVCTVLKALISVDRKN